MISDHDFADLKTLVLKHIATGFEEGERSAAESLNQTVRRLRAAEGESEIASLLVNTTPAYAQRMACLIFDGDRARVTAFRGIAAAPEPFFAHEAPALLSAIETHDTMVAAATAAELSQALFTASDAVTLTEPKAHLIPVMVHGSVLMVLFAAEDVHAASLEILCNAAGLRLESLAMENVVKSMPDEPPSLIQIGGAHAAAPKWSELSSADQTLHLRAQRFAQVAVARMRVERNAAVRDGQQRADLYSALQPEIDAARAEYRSQFLTGQSKTMVDYLYLELVRSLANDEDRLLGAGFPGRLT